MSVGCALESGIYSFLQPDELLQRTCTFIMTKDATSDASLQVFHHIPVFSILMVTFASVIDFDVILSVPGLPDPFAKISVDGSGQCHSTDTCKNTLDPKWNQHYDL